MYFSMCTYVCCIFVCTNIHVMCACVFIHVMYFILENSEFYILKQSSCRWLHLKSSQSLSTFVNIFSERQKLGSSYPQYVHLFHFTYLLSVIIFPTTWLSRLPLYPTPHGLKSVSGPSGPFFHRAPQPLHSSPIFLIVSQLPQPLCVLGLWACWPVSPYYSSVSYPVSLAVVLTSLVEGGCYYFLKRLYIFCLFIKVYFTRSNILLRYTFLSILTNGNTVM